MGSPTIESDTEPASEVHSSPQATPEKSKAHLHRRRKPTKIVIKQKEFKIFQGARCAKKLCTLCGKKFKCQKDLNDHTMDDHSYRFLCHKRTCGGELSSKAALNKHALTHMPPRYLCTTCGHGFKFQYQLRNHSNTHTDFQIKCRYPRCWRVYKSESEYNRHYKLHKTAYQESDVPPVVRSLQKKKI